MREDGVLAPGVASVSIGSAVLISLLALEYIAVAAAMPTVAADLDGYDLYNLAFGATVATSLVGTVLGGWWSDRSGPRAVVVAGAGAFAVGLLVAGFAGDFRVFCVGRAIQGLGSGLANVALYVVIAQLVPDRIRPRVFSLLAAAWVVPGLVGPLLTGLIVERLTWHWIFYGVTPFVLLAVLLMAPALARTRPAGGARTLPTSLLAWTVAAAAAVGILNLVGARVSPTAWALGAGLLVVLVAAARHLLPGGTLRLGRGLPSVVATRGALGGSFIAAEAYLPLMLRDEHGYGPAQAGAILAVAAMTWTVGSTLQGRLGPTADRYRLITAGAAWFTTLMVVLAAGVALGGPGWFAVACYGLAIAGVGLAYPTTTLVTMRLSTEAEVGRNSSALQLAEALASAVGLAFSGVVFGTLYATHQRAAFVGTLVVSCVVGALSVVAAVRARPAAA
ncbi:putative drug resistance transporter [Mobilicoccus pelagius NBRC 104925]|uniref:Putative drug resistance transporter n=1 Tax=Mobilicoccus pelagius NBRC 104925 TaxID=1089455 RepID=H5UVA1_9MICO|nr:putative drug resistance transporter [Mobilicoccus pelagius NBRC 104925]